MTSPIAVHDDAGALLTAVGYQPASRLAHAALRLSQAPDIVADLRTFVAAGQPPADYDTRTPPCLFRPLPLALCVADLMREAGLAASGAFLMAALLTYDSARGEALLLSMVENGVWHVADDGTRSLRFPPLFKPSSQCGHCGRPQFRDVDHCVHCGLPLRAAEPSPEQQALADFLVWLDTLPDMPSVDTSTCQHCGRALGPSARFCGGCGAKID
ncbi:MAG: zinc ribbon domain-containing protein [Gemmatimonadaceae bacterium]|nr:zinc ribbon domain-containing protein [Gemmatimonadaceae bacterium]